MSEAIDLALVCKQHGMTWRTGRRGIHLRNPNARAEYQRTYIPLHLPMADIVRSARDFAVVGMLLSNN